MKQWGRKLRYILSSRLTLLAAVLVLAGLVVSLGRESYRKYQLDKEIRALETQIQELEGENRQLAGLMDYFKQDSYLEKEARIKLNLKKPGETVVVLSGDDQTDTPAPEPESIDIFTSPAENTANHWKWWEYFFSES